jgi:hypothetical protein
MPEQPKSRWFRFSLRSLFIIVTVLGCWLGWESSVVRQRKALLKKLDASIAFELTTAEEWQRRYINGPPPGEPVAKVRLVRRWLGDVAIQEIGYYEHIYSASSAELSQAKRVFPEARLRPRDPPLEPCHPGCFPRGTLVETLQGRRLIETILPGDLLTVILPEGSSASVAVQSVFVTHNRLWQIDTSAGRLITTQIQPICVATDRTVRAGDLQPGQSILHYENGELRAAEVASVAPTDRIEQVFNLVLSNSEVFVAGGFLARSKPPALVAE